MEKTRTVFIIHGRDEAARKAMFSFLRDLDLHPLEWEELVTATGSTSAYTGEVVSRAFVEAQAVVALLTPDDMAALHPSLREEQEPSYEVELSGQARPNVLLEAGMAMGMNEKRTIIVEIGRLRPLSDLAGRNVVRIDGSVGKLQKMVQRLKAAGCAVNDHGDSWLEVDRFKQSDAHSRVP